MRGSSNSVFIFCNGCVTIMKGVHHVVKRRVRSGDRVAFK